MNRLTLRSGRAEDLSMSPGPLQADGAIPAWISETFATAHGLQPGARLQLPGPGVMGTPRDRGTAIAAAELGYLDEVIKPEQTRPKVIRAFAMLRTKRQALPPKKHGNPPL